ncbi:MAG TPA: protein kinase, partial [Humisphaera sp.]|nr:protein kinase [Humisphaera sp.]
GEVWVAKQSAPVKRKVALKLIKTGMDSRAVLNRFEQERQALAMMDHPNIARVLDGGMTQTGQPFFVMELVNGLPLTRFCDEAKLTPRQRLELFVPICQAVQHAHQKGIVHRDLKPANILVTLVDGQPVPKVIDFGVAKATGGKLTEETVSTGFGAAVGTLEYMSPEQAGYSNVDVDTRADIYSLGVILYQLLTGLVPIDGGRLRNVALAEMIRIIQEEEPSKPSTRLSTDQSLPSLAALRQIDPYKLMTLLRGELDWVVMKCLEKSRERRYETASALGKDIQRYLADEPVDARPPSASYRMQKFVRRNKGRVIAASLLLLALLGGMTGTSWGLLAAKRALGAEARQRNIAERAADERERARAAAEYEKNQKEQARAAADKALYFNRINLAAQYWQSGNLEQSGRILDLCAPNVRGWEWRYLDRLHHADLQTLPGDGRITTDLQLSSDGRRLAAFSPNGIDSRVRIWDLSRGQSLTEIEGQDIGRQFTCCAMAPDGQMIAIGERSGAISFWNPQSGRITREFAKLPRSINSLSFSPDGKWLAAARAEWRNGEMVLPVFESPRFEDFVVWDVGSGAEVFHPKGYGFVAAFSPDGTRLLTFKMNTALRLTPITPETQLALFDTSNWTEVNAGKLGSPKRFAFSVATGKLALGDDDRMTGIQQIRLIDAANGSQLAAFSPGLMAVNFDIALSPDASLLAMTQGLIGGEIEVWDTKAPRPIRTLRGHTQAVNSLTFTPDGKLLSCSADRTIKVWDPTSDPQVQTIVSPSGAYTSPAVLAASGKLLAYSQSSTTTLTGVIRSITLVDVGSDRRPPTTNDDALSQLGRALFRGGAGPNDRTLAGNPGGTISLAFSSDGNRLASGGRNGEVKTWDVASRAELATYRGHDGEIGALSLSPDGRRVASANVPPEFTRALQHSSPWPTARIPTPVKVCDAASGRELLSLEGHVNGVSQVAFSPDGRWLASTGNGQVKIWDLANGKLLRELEAGEMRSGVGDALTFSRRGDLLVTAGNQIVQVWDASSGHSVAVFRGHRAGSLAVAISPDQARLATAAGEQVKIWDIQSGLESLTLPLSQSGPNERIAPVVALAWSDNGQSLRAARNDASVVEWNAAPPRK